VDYSYLVNKHARFGHTFFKILPVQLQLKLTYWVTFNVAYIRPHPSSAHLCPRNSHEGGLHHHHHHQGASWREGWGTEPRATLAAPLLLHFLAQV